MVNDLIQGFDEEIFCAFVNGQFSGSLSRRVVNLPKHEEFSWDSARLVGVVKSLAGSKGENRPLVVVCVKLGEGDVLTERSSRIKQFKFAKKVLDDAMATPAPGVEGILSQGLFAFYDEKGNFRLSLVYGEAEGTKLKWSSTKRLSFYVAAGEPNKTFRDRVALDWSTFDKLKEAFSVEKLTKEFYTRLFAWYQRAMESDEVAFPNDLVKDKEPGEVKSEQIIRLITRLMFVWFLKQKHLVPGELFEPERLNGILKNFDPGKGETYYRAILQNLFFATLNTEIPERAFAIEGSRQENEEHFGVKIFYRYAAEFAISEEEVIRLFRSIPFMNGGLFECLDRDNLYYDGFSRRKGKQARVPNALFFDEKGLIPLLSQYNFTVEENSPGDEEVALDPEMLGKVFENLLAAYNPETNTQARKATGSFYTPREIVNYMVDESLIAHLCTKCGEEHAEPIRRLFREGERPADEKLCAAMDHALVTAKILDPACGSGAFPMGILLRMVELLRILRQVPEGQSVYALKLELIKNCIYGGDIQCIAVQISKLRFFISLVCEQKPTADAKENYGIHTLPNLESKFVAADSLIGLPKDGKDVLDLCTGEIADLKNELFEVRLRHFSARSYQEKKELRKEDRTLRAKIKKTVKRDAEPDRSKLELLKKEREKVAEPKWVAQGPKPKTTEMFAEFSGTGGTEQTPFDENAKKRKQLDLEISREEQKVSLPTTVVDEIADMLASWDPYDQNTSAKFSDPEWMFNVKDGFDVVIGNPPYSQVKKEKYNSVQFPFSEGKDKGKQNLYKLFVEHSYNSVKNDAIICLIVQSSLMCDISAKHTRELLLNHTTIKFFIEFPKTPPTAEGKVFESVLQGTCVFLLRKNTPKINVTFEISSNNDITTISELQTENVIQKNLLEFYPEGYCIPLLLPNEFKILEKVNKLTIKFIDLIETISQGDINLTNSKKEIVGFTTEVKLLRGRNISRFSINYNVDEYLSEKLTKNVSSVKFQGGYLVCQEVTGTVDKRRLHFAETDSGGFLFGHTANKIKLNDLHMNKYMLGLLNSQFMDWYFRKTSTNNHVGGYQIVELPISISESVQPNIEALVNLILKEKKSNPAADTSALEAEIDQLVYKLYDLTEEEIAIVEGATAASSKPAKTDSKASEPKTVESGKAKSARKAQPKLPPSLPGWD